MGNKLGADSFQLNEQVCSRTHCGYNRSRTSWVQFHHVIWMGDLNYHSKGLTSADAITLIQVRACRAWFRAGSGLARGLCARGRRGGAQKSWSATTSCGTRWTRRKCFTSTVSRAWRLISSRPTRRLRFVARCVQCDDGMPFGPLSFRDAQVDMSDPEWARRVYVTEFKEPFYKGVCAWGSVR